MRRAKAYEATEKLDLAIAGNCRVLHSVLVVRLSTILHMLLRCQESNRVRPDIHGCHHRVRTPGEGTCGGTGTHEGRSCRFVYDNFC